MRRIIIISWAGFVFGTVFLMLAAPKWIQSTWLWACVAYLLVVLLVIRDHQKTQEMQRLLARCVRLERTMIGLIRMHHSVEVHDAFLREGRQGRSFGPNVDEIRDERKVFDSFTDSAMNNLFFPRNL